MSEAITATLSLQRWQGDRGTYHLVNFTGEAAEALTTHATLHRLEFGRQRGFGSVKVMAQIGDTQWKSSVFPMNVEDEKFHRTAKKWTLLISKKLMKAESLAHGDEITVTVTPI